MATSSIIEQIIIADKKAAKIIEDGLKKKSKPLSNRKITKEVEKMEREGAKLFKKLFLK